jgi:hypothetical protein
MSQEILGGNLPRWYALKEMVSALSREHCFDSVMLDDLFAA